MKNRIKYISSALLFFFGIAFAAPAPDKKSPNATCDKNVAVVKSEEDVEKGWVQSTKEKNESPSRKREYSSKNAAVAGVKGIPTSQYNTYKSDSFKSDGCPQGENKVPVISSGSNVTASEREEKDKSADEGRVAE